MINATNVFGLAALYEKGRKRSGKIIAKLRKNPRGDASFAEIYSLACPLHLQLFSGECEFHFWHGLRRNVYLQCNISFARIKCWSNAVE